MKTRLFIAIALAWAVPAHAAEPIPAHLAGMWSTADSLYAGTTGQSELYLLEDGSGAIGFSSPPPTATSGPDKGKLLPHQRVILGFAFRAKLEGEVLVLHPAVKPSARGGQPPQVRLAYRQTPEGPTLGAPDQAIPGETLKRRSDTVPERIATMIREGVSATEAGAARPAPATFP